MSFENQVSALTKGHKLKLEDSCRDVILIVGRSGVGKSTMAEILFGDVSALESTFDEEFLCNKLKNTKIASKRGEHSMFQSDTICPQLFTDSTKPGLAIYDCPGFADTRGTSNEIATGVYLSEIVQHANRVKLVAIVDYDTVKPNADRDKFTDRILSEVLDLVLDNNIYGGGVFLLVTKYANPLDFNNQFDDEVILRSIAKFLQVAQKHAVMCTEDKKRRNAIDALFDNSWLLEKDGKYPNLGFSRTITGVGNLSGMESLTRRSQIRTQILENPHFVFKPSDRKHFGCPISEAAKLEIRKVQKNLCSEAEVHLGSVGQKVINKFTDSAKCHDQLSTFLLQYIEFLNSMSTLTEAESGLSVKTLEVLHNFCRKIDVNDESDMNSMMYILNCLKHLSSVDIVESTAIWRDADQKLEQANLSLAKDLMIGFRKAQQNLAAETNMLLKSLGQRVIIQFAKSTDKSIFALFQKFWNNLKALPKEKSGLSDKGLELLRSFSMDIGEDIGHEVDKLVEIISCLNFLAEVDDQSPPTWSDVHMNWDHAMDFISKDVAQLKAQRDFIAAEAQAKLDIARAEAELLEAKTRGEIAAATAAKELADTRAAADRAKADAERELLQAKAAKETAEANARAEVNAVKQRAELAEAAARAAHQTCGGRRRCVIQ